MRRKVGVYVKSRGAALIRGAATNREFMVVSLYLCESNCSTYDESEEVPRVLSAASNFETSARRSIFGEPCRIKITGICLY